jgi:glycosyltransferase involved in cell wall biosynthesis
MKEVVRTVRFSVIIPVQSRAKQLMLTLAAFEKQTCPIDQFEVVVVDDASRDDTLAQLQHYRPPYKLTVVSLSRPVGRAVARNIGVAASSEDTLIFVDSDFLVFPDFIRTHEAYHIRHPNTVISGMPNLMRGAYTQFHADFSPEEKAQAAEVLRNNGVWNEAWMRMPHTVDLVTPDDIRRGTGRLEQVLIPWNDDDPNWREFRATDVAPWILCVTRNVSMSRSLFERAGWFDGVFQKYGLEDWELGYRLHVHGYKFISMAEMTGVHQEHPAAVRNKEGNEENLRFFFGKHGLRNPEVSLLAIHSPEDGLPVYKNALRILWRLRRNRSARHRLTELRFRNLCTRTAVRFVHDPQSEAYLRDKRLLQQAILAANEVFTSRLPEKAKLGKMRRILDRAILDVKRANKPAPRVIRARRRKRAARGSKKAR